MMEKSLEKKLASGKKNLSTRDVFMMSFDALKKNSMRSILATVGIIIGISTLILVLGISNAAKGLISDQLASFGTDTIFVEVKVPDADSSTSSSAIVGGVQIKTMKMADVIGVRKLPNIKNSYAAVITQQKVVYLQNNKKSIIYGTTPSYTQVDRSKVEKGRYFTDSENESLAKVAVLGNTVKENLFGSQDPIGKSIKINGISFRVIGVMEKRGGALFQNYDEYVYLPIKTEQKLLLGYDYLPYFVVQLSNSNAMDQTADELRRFLRKQHDLKSDNIKKDDFEITTSKDSQDSLNVAFGSVSILFSGIAGLSLIVGGVGIMNIMYVSVTERIREIGLRKALGARKNAILLQFLIESTIITLMGGILGILFGLLLSYLITLAASFADLKLNISVTAFNLGIGIVVTTFFGIIFGLGPAKKAADLKPIEALRAE